jgi:hypothetical protein
MTLTRPDVVRLLEGETLLIDAGCDLLDARDVFIADISDDLDVDGSSVEFHHDATIRTTARIKLRRQLDWGRQRLRPWITVANGTATTRDVLTASGSPVWDDHTGTAVTIGETARTGYAIERWDLGVFLMETPSRPLGATPVHYEIDCYDKLVILDTPLGRTFHVAEGELLLDAASSLIRTDLLSAIRDFAVDTDANGVANGWTVTATGTTTSSSQSLQTVLGRHFQRFTSTVSSGAARILRTAVNVIIEPDTDYTLTVWTKGTRQPNSGTRMWLTQFDANSATLGQPAPTDVPAGTDWALTTYQFHSDPAARFASLAWHLTTTAATTAATTLDVWQPSLVKTAEDSAIYRDTSAGLRTAHKEATWPVVEAATALEIINELLAMAGCADLYCDRNGRYHMEKLVDLVAAAPEWVFDWDSATTVVTEDRTETIDLWDVPNEWVFVRSVDPGTDEAPSFGEGYLTVTNQSAGPASLDARAGRAVRSVTSVDAADQLAFEAQVAEIIQDEKSPSHIVEITASPVPVLWDRQVVSYADSAIPGDIEAVTPIKMTVDAWTLPLDGSDATYTLSMVSTDILATPPPAVISGGTSHFDANGFHYEVFTANGTLTCVGSGSIEVWVIGGGGGGGYTTGSGVGYGGGGGGGDLVHGTYVLEANQTVTIGAGGAGGAGGGTVWQGRNGATTLLGSLASAIGGGGGGASLTGYYPGVAGACGGGGGYFNSASPPGAAGGFGSIGYDGGAGGDGSTGSGGGGGGGLNGAGKTPTYAGPVRGDGGAGIGLTITASGTEIFYCAGGGGAGPDSSHAGLGGSDSAGGNGGLQTPATAGTDASTNGSGGGGGGESSYNGGAGKAGLVVVRTALP